jgi:hypothetical protein
VSVANPHPTTDYHIFAVYHRNTAVSFIPDSGATHILIRDSDAHVLHSIMPFLPHTRKPQFEFANGLFIVPTSSGLIRFPGTTVTPRAFIFRDHDLVDNLFGIAPLLRHGYTATFTEHDFALHTPEKVLLYGTKALYSHTPIPGDFRCHARKTFAHPPSSATNNTPNRSCLLTPRSGHHPTPHSTPQ